MQKQIPLFLLFLSLVNLNAQNTVGLLSYNPTKASNGFNLIYPHNQPSVFLLNNCGEIMHQWDDDDNIRPGNMAYINENGTLFKCKRLLTSAVDDRIWAGGGGETIELRSWENELLASFTLNNDKFRLHHDIAPLPNGNVLMIAWELKTGTEALEAGRDTSKLSRGEVWSERILEWNPLTNQIVWEWSVWDHLIQDFDSKRNNFGTIADHPELINVNYDEHGGHPDWLHINAIDYNPVLDQIVLSVPCFNEFWIIDHSTTTDEARESIGGISKKGGDLIYRWGNPATYNQGTEADKQLFFQHDVHWINPKSQEGDKYYGQIALFNNRIATNLSTGNIVNTNFNAVTKNYEITNGVFLPIEFEKSYQHPRAEIESRAASTSVSSFQVLPNDNVLFCSGRNGYSYEINSENKVIWEYFTPFQNGMPVEQGDTSISISNNLTFRLNRYDIDYPAFEGRNLEPSGYIELNPNENFCGTLSVNTKEIIAEDLTITAFPNPANQKLTIVKGKSTANQLFLYDLFGRRILSSKSNDEIVTLDVSCMVSGIYFLGTERTIVKKIMIEKN